MADDLTRDDDEIGRATDEDVMDVDEFEDDDVGEGEEDEEDEEKEA